MLGGVFVADAFLGHILEQVFGCLRLSELVGSGYAAGVANRRVSWFVINY